jgi:T-complex protein 1 subunit beta
VIKKVGGTLSDSFMDTGLILDQKIGLNQAKRLKNAKILIANTSLDTDKVKVFGSRFKVESPEQLAELERAEREKMREKIEKIKAHGANCFVNRQLIYNWPEQLLAEAGILTIEHADFEGVERLALVTGGHIASTFDTPQSTKLGSCEVVEEIMIGDDRLVRFAGGISSEACTIVLRGATQQILEEAERSLHDALCVLSQTVAEPKVVFGAGVSEMLMANAIDMAIPQHSGKQMLAMEGFARALRQLPTIIADNGGFDSCELVAQLRSMHAQGFKSAGLDMVQGKVGDISQLGIVESLKLKRQVLVSASEAAEMILRVDDIIRAAPRPRNRH